MAGRLGLDDLNVLSNLNYSPVLCNNVFTAMNEWSCLSSFNTHIYCFITPCISNSDDNLVVREEWQHKPKVVHACLFGIGINMKGLGERAAQGGAVYKHTTKVCGEKEK